MTTAMMRMVVAATPLLFTLLNLLAVSNAFNNPASVPVWCGKAYMASNASFPPGGVLSPPKPAASPLLDLKVRPRMSLYLAGEQQASFIVDAALSYIHGATYPSTGSSSGGSSSSSSSSSSNGSSAVNDTLTFDISVSGTKLVSSKTVKVNSTGNEFAFSLTGLKPQTSPYVVQISAKSAKSGKTYTATSGGSGGDGGGGLYLLPKRTDGGSATKIDSLYGGLLVKPNSSSSAWQQLFPYSYYASWSGYFQNNASAVATFKSLGYNIVHVVPDGSVPLGFNYTEFDAFLTECDKQGLWVMYDMRWSYLNTSAVAAQVRLYQKHPSMLLWYTADEPDGQTDPLNSTTLAYNTIKSIDPYHPVSLVLNCANFYFKEYTAQGADIILEDAYPVGINATYSVEWHTPCNSTYGDCGCDGCEGSLSDISTRLDTLRNYQTWLGGSQTSKPLWGVPQAFDGRNEYWSYVPAANEEIAMQLLSINHGAKGLVAWTWPTPAALQDITSRFAKVVGGATVTGYLLNNNARPVRVLEGGDGAGKDVDAAVWGLPVSNSSASAGSTKGKKVLVGVTFLGYKNTASSAPATQLQLPDGLKAASVSSTLWGNGGWSVQGGSGPTAGLLVRKSLTALQTDLLEVTLA